MNIAYDLFFLHDEDQVSANEILLSNKAEYQHIAKSLRKSIASYICLSDGQEFYYDCKILDINSKQVHCEIINKHNIIKPKLSLSFFPAILKGSTFELLLEKAVELGVSAIQPVITDNTIAKKDKINKWQNIIVKALKQSKQAKMIQIEEAKTLKTCKPEGLVLVPEIDISTNKISDITEAKSTDLNLFIGPEGGFSKNEISTFKEMNAKFVTLGENRLRAETAAWKSIILIQEIR